MIAFLPMGRESGSLDFASFRTLSLSPGLASAVISGLLLVLARSRDDAVAQLVAARSPCRTIARLMVMSDVIMAMEIGFFGILESSDGSAGGTGYQTVAGSEYRRKRRHYFVAVGVAMVGLSLHDPLLTVVGLLGALFHLLNHALFKGLLFLGAGAIISRLHTHDMEKMGALAKRMPWTAAACLIGCLAISAIPPLNGFISEWYTWQSLFSLSRVEAVALQLAGPIAMVMLAVTGGLAVMCFVKMYGITFCGAPRSTHAEEAQEVPNTMIVAMLLLAALCVLIALSASWLAPKIMHIAHAFTDTPPVTVASGIALVPGTFHTRVTPSLLLLLLLAMPLLPGLYWLWCRSRRAAFRRTGDAWACGYGWENAMAPSGNGVMQPLRVVFCALFRLRQQLDPTLRLNKGLAHVTARAQSTEPFWDERVIRPIVSATQRLAKEIQHLQSGDFRLYCLYVVAALVVLLIAIAV